MKKALSLALLLALPAAAAKEAPTCSTESKGLLSRATDCWNKKDYGCAKLKVENVLEHQPNCAQALFLNAFILERDGKEEAAERSRKRALELDPKLEDFWEERGHYIETELSTPQEFSNFEVRFYGAENRDKA